MSYELPDLLFHGTAIDFDRPRVNLFDGAFWLADSSAVAQCYIPASPGRIALHLDSWELDKTFFPVRDDPRSALAARMGFVPEEVEWDAQGHARQFTYPKKGWVKNRDLCQYLEEGLGYSTTSPHGKAYGLKTSGRDPHPVLGSLPRIERADFLQPGFLLMVRGHDTLRLRNLSRGDGDASNPQCNQVDRFHRLTQAGWDGVIIDDHTQSPKWGNVGHRAIGIFEHALPGLHIERIPARHFDWTEALNESSSPEFTAWQMARRARQVLDSVAAAPSTKP